MERDSVRHRVSSPPTKD